MITDPVFYGVAVIGVILVGLGKGGFGSSISMMGVPLMALVISPVQAAAVMLPILIVMDVVGLISYRGTFDRRTLSILLPAAMIGITVGWATAHFFSDDMIRLLIGLMAFLFAVNYWRKPAVERARAYPHSPPKGLLWGTVSGFTSFLAHAGGPPYQMYTLPLRQEPRLYAGTSVIFFSVVNAVKVLPYLMLGQFSTANLATSAVLLPLAPIATLFGVWLVKKVPKDPFYTITYACMLIASIKLLWDGVASFL